jgi:hypothetical protein
MRTRALVDARTQKALVEAAIESEAFSLGDAELVPFGDRGREPTGRVGLAEHVTHMTRYG